MEKENLSGNFIKNYPIPFDIENLIGKNCINLIFNYVAQLEHYDKYYYVIQQFNYFSSDLAYKNFFSKDYKPSNNLWRSLMFEIKLRHVKNHNGIDTHDHLPLLLYTTNISHLYPALVYKCMCGEYQVISINNCTKDEQEIINLVIKRRTGNVCERINSAITLFLM